MLLKFNEKPLVIHGTPGSEPSQEAIRQTFGLLNASVRDAVMYGGEVVRQAFSDLPFELPDSAVVDVKVHMLMKGMNPAIPGWHTDGVFRGSDGQPDLERDNELTPIDYLLWVSGSKALTQFLTTPFTMDVPKDIGSDLYREMNIRVGEFVQDWKHSDFEDKPNIITTVPSCQWVSWNSRNIHRGVPSTGSEWRILIRIAMSDRLRPQTDLRSIIRLQQQIYCPENYGW